jgi:NAD/NADP transhydrogenase beta subunit
VGLSDFWLESVEKGEIVDNITLVSILLSILIGGITFTGSMVAYGKLSGKVSGNAIVFTGQHFINLLLLVDGYCRRRNSFVAAGYDDWIYGLWLLYRWYLVFW